MGAAGNPAFGLCRIGASDVAWKNDMAVGFATAAFYRDPYGIVHLKGSVSCPGVVPQTGAVIFTLPAGYAPDGELWFPISADGGPASVFTFHAASVNYATGALGADGRLSLDGVSWRCAPSGANGCP